MSFWLQKSYIGQISGSLRNFRWKDAETANFSCPICNDSQKDSRKARGFLHCVNDKKTYERTFMYTCHNGCQSKSFNSFLRHVNQTLYSEYRLACFKEHAQGSQKPTETPKQEKQVAPQVSLKNDVLVPCSSLPETHEAVVYLRNRKIPDLSKFHWAENFYLAIQSLSLETKITVRTDPRVCLIMRDPTGNPTGIIGRQIDQEADPKFRYLTIKFDKDFPKIYGLENLNKTHVSFLTEGPIDSLYLPNALALCGGFMSFDTLESFTNKDNMIVALDNEPRKPETVDHMQKFAEAGYNIVVWHGMSSELKDISDMICKGGLSVREILAFIATHTYSGLQAQQEINKWKRIESDENKSKSRGNQNPMVISRVSNLQENLQSAFNRRST